LKNVNSYSGVIKVLNGVLGKSIDIEEAAASTTANAERIFFKNSL